MAVCCAVLCSTCLLEGGQLGHGHCACAHGPGLAGRLWLGCHHSHHLFISSSLVYLLIYFNPLLGFWSLLEVKYKPRSQQRWRQNSPLSEHSSQIGLSFADRVGQRTLAQAVPIHIVGISFQGYIYLVLFTVTKQT